MADARALSRWEIDALLTQLPIDGDPLESGADQLAPGGVTRGRGFARSIRPYDFRRPDRFSKEQWQTIQAMHETYARLVGTTFSSRVRELVQVRLSSLEQGLYAEWQSQVPARTVCYIFTLPTLGGSVAIEFNHDVAAEVVDRLLGGTGILVDRSRDLTEIEGALLRSFSGALEPALRGMWELVAPVAPELSELGHDPELIQLAGPNDVVVTAFFEISLGTQLGAMSMCTPYTVVEPVAGQLSHQLWLHASAAVRRDDTTRLAIEGSLRGAPLDISVSLGGATLPARHVANLAPGDTILLDTRVDAALPLAIGGLERFRVRPGRVGRNVGVTVTGITAPPGSEPETGPRPAHADPVPGPHPGTTPSDHAIAHEETAPREMIDD